MSNCLKVICWALIFICKLRFPPGVSIATVLKQRFFLQFRFPTGSGNLAYIILQILCIEDVAYENWQEKMKDESQAKIGYLYKWMVSCLHCEQVIQSTPGIDFDQSSPQSGKFFSLPLTRRFNTSFGTP
jgi:hypothetical protein